MSQTANTNLTGFRNGTIFLVSCSSKKLRGPAKAKDIYMPSALFRKSRAYVESTGKPWFILSAKYGLLDIEKRISRYNKTLNNMRKKKRCKWAQKILKDFIPHLEKKRIKSVVILAGSRYREFLEPELRDRGFHVYVPMRGLRIGEQLAWLDESDPLRLIDTIRFYDILKRLEKRVGGAAQVLANCDGRMNWPNRGVYFFYEYGERRLGPGCGLRVVRVGTHAVSTGSKTKLWTRLSQHRGPASHVGGKINGSVFRVLVGNALAKRNNLPLWSKCNKTEEKHLGSLVSRHICAMPFLWLNVGDTPGPKSRRAFIECNAIALLSDYDKPPIDPASTNWLGLSSPSSKVRGSGLWNQEHVDRDYDPSFLEEMEKRIDITNPLY